MSNSYFQFKQFIIHQDRCAMKVTTDGCLFGAWIAQKIKSGNAGPRKLLDIGTGTGLLSMLLAQENNLAIDAVEIDKDAFEQATENVRASPWNGTIKVFHADAMNFEASDQYDIIISNPPFYEKEWKGDDLKKNLAHHNDGLLFPGLLQIVKKNLKPDGRFFLLLPFKRNEEIKKLFVENELAIQQLTLARQSINHAYFRILLEGKLKRATPNETMIDEISIKDDNDQYTQEFIHLLNVYYLHL